MAGAIHAAPYYLVHGKLGAGGMGVVYRATWITPAGERPVAVKRLLVRGEVDIAARDRLIAEARLVFQLRHANICQVLDLGENEDGTYVVMELVEGLDLRTLLRELARTGQRLDPAIALHICREIARALDYAHRRRDGSGHLLRLVHGDVTPANILLSVEGEVKLGDFGIARAVGTAAPGTQLRAGTPGFVPEDAHAEHDPAIDLYALAVTLLVAITGSSASSDRRVALASCAEISPRGAELIRRAIEPSAGFASAAELEAALSEELARRHPMFTASALGALVRKHAGVPEPVVEAAQGTTKLYSIATAPSHDAVAGTAATAPDKPLRLTETNLPVRRRGRGIVAIASIASVAGAAVIVWRLSGASAKDETAVARPPPLAPSPSPSPEPVAQPPPPATPPSKPPEPVSADTEIPKPVRQRARPAPAVRTVADKAFLTINSTPWGAVYVDGKRVAEATPVYRLPIAAGAHRVSVFYPDTGHYSDARRVDVKPGEGETVVFRREPAP